MKKIALVGNPNVGKTSLFNQLTQLRHKVGNYPGVTVSKREGKVTYNEETFQLIDLPGTYSLYPNSIDEQIVFNILQDKNHPDYPDLAIVIGEPSNLKRAIILYQQVRELGVPAIFVINMIDELSSKGAEIDLEKLEAYLDTKVITTNAREGVGLNELKEAFHYHPIQTMHHFILPEETKKVVEEVKSTFQLEDDYLAWHYLAQKKIPALNHDQQQKIDDIRREHNFIYKRLQVKEIVARNRELDLALDGIVNYHVQTSLTTTEKIDKILMHPILGYLFFFLVMFLMFQAVYFWATPFMDAIDEGFAWLISWLSGVLPTGPFSDLMGNGFVAGIGGIVIFIPQIMLLFFLIAMMEETGYMSRIVYLSDRFLKPFGMSGKSVVPLVSGIACAVPAVMSARTIENTKERLLTMLVTPFMTCSARLPIYLIIIELVIPAEKIGWFDYRGIALFVMYLLGIVGALGSSFILNKIIPTSHRSFFAIELPNYKMPDWKNVFTSVYESVSGFVFDAGKIILSMAVILWVMSNFSFKKDFYHAEEVVQAAHPTMNGEELEREVKSFQVTHSILGQLGHFIEPAIRPLGYDWKMGIGVISSFAAREVFVGTMAMVYSMNEDFEDEEQKVTLLQRMKSEINHNTGKPAYNLASGVSLLLFYAFAMQCMSTIAIVKKETGSWKWTLLQAGLMTGIAYILALIAYQLLK